MSAHASTASGGCAAVPDDSPAERWAARLRAFAPGAIAEIPLLRDAARVASVLLHGSTTRGIDDAFSDLDVWVVAPRWALGPFRAAGHPSFHGFSLDGKEGHFTIEERHSFARRVHECDLPLIAELRLCRVLADPAGWAGALLERVRQPMREEVRNAWFCYHYVEMRGEHRACDNPIERGDPLAVLVAAARVVEHARQAALVLDGEPYPYSKWLAAACACTPTGSRLMPVVLEVLDVLAADGLRAPGPEKHHPLSRKLREIRQVLIEGAQASGLDEPWLREWWLHIDRARAAVASVSW